MTQDKGDLLDGLKALGCRVEETEKSTFVALPDEYAEFVFEHMDSWIYLGTTFMAPDEVTGSEHGAALDRFLLELQDRSLGCHFSYDRAGYLTIGNELQSGELTAQDLLGAMEQIAYVIEVCLPVCDGILQTGDTPDDKEMDNAFGLHVSLH